jgi:hypothetical protein
MPRVSAAISILASGGAAFAALTLVGAVAFGAPPARAQATGGAGGVAVYENGGNGGDPNQAGGSTSGGGSVASGGAAGLFVAVPVPGVEVVPTAQLARQPAETAAWARIRPEAAQAPAVVVVVPAAAVLRLRAVS